MADIKVEDYFPMVHSIVRHFKIHPNDYEDVCQDLKMKLLSLKKTYDAEKGAQFQTYAYVSMKRHMYTRFREQAKKMKIQNLNSNIEDKKNHFSEVELNDLLEDGMDEEERRVISIMSNGGTLKRCCEMTGKSKKQIKAILKRIREKLV